MDRKELLLLAFLKVLDKYAFVESINSVTGEREQFQRAVTDMEATIRISGEWDREDLKDALASLLQ
jgi:hypothetical protein